MDKEELFQKRLLDLAKTAFQRDIVTFTGFLSLNELHMVNSLNKSSLGISLETFGGYEFAERQIAAFIPDALSYDWNYPLACIKIAAKGSKFTRQLTHRDYLGALVNLGIDRQTLGDILVKEDGAYVFCLDRMAAFLEDNLAFVARTAVTVREITSPGELPTQSFSEIRGTVASVRLDSVIATAFKTSRSSMNQEIQAGKVFVNGKMITSNGYHLKEKDIVSVRGQGKFQFLEVASQTKKGRFTIVVNRYI